MTNGHPLGYSNGVAATVVCLVDDDESVRKSISRLLESAGFKVCAFCGAEPFLEHVAKTHVGLVILDIWMEPMTGLQLLVHLCAKSPQTQVIFMTGVDDEAAERAVRQAGAFAFFHKPFDDEKFLTAVRAATSVPPLR
ncbi:MAG: response regulator transcription factor [Chthoniobacterales bacterium]